MMFTLSDRAVTQIRLMTTEDALIHGLRIARPNDRPDLVGIEPVQQPKPTDILIERSGAQVYMAPDLEDYLERMQLDARLRPNGQVEFLVSPPP